MVASVRIIKLPHTKMAGNSGADVPFDGLDEYGEAEGHEEYAVDKSPKHLGPRPPECVFVLAELQR